MNKTILVLNMGMKSIRSIIFDSEGNKLASSSIPITTSLSGNTVTQNPAEWIEKARIVIADSAQQIENAHIDYLTVTTSASCLVCIDKQGNALMPCMMVSDKRAVYESDFIRTLDEFKDVYKDTELAMDASLLLPKALWVLKHQPKTWSKIYKLLTPNDFLIGWLTGGIYATDYMNAQKWHYSAKTKKYPERLLEKIGILSSLLPDVVAPGAQIANIDKALADEFAINEDAKVVASTYDAICSFIGSGVHEEGDAADISGTVTVFRAVTYKKDFSISSKIQRISFEEHQMNIVGGSNNLGGGLIEWVKQSYYLNEHLTYELMEKEAREASLGAGGLIFLPYLLGERAPIWDSNARGVFFGLERMHTRKEMTRAVFESAGYIDLDMISAIEECGVAVKSIRLSGGLARLQLVSQIKADITGKEIIVLSEFETTATGAAMIALLGQKDYASLEEASNYFVNVRMIIKPNMKNYEQYQKLYSLFKETYKTLKPLFPKRMELVELLYKHKKIKIENL